MGKGLVDVLITTYPAHKSQNVGDNMIAQSAIKLIKSRNPKFDPTIIFREKSLDGLGKNRVRSLIAPGFSVSNDTYPGLFPLYTDLNRLKNFFPIGCSYQNIIPSENSFYENPYNENTQEFLEMLANKFGPIPCRDDLIVNRLKKFNIPAVYSGDMVLFDEDYIDTNFMPPSQIKTLVFTIQHHLHYLEQSIALLKEIKKYFPKTKLYIAMHSVPSASARTVSDRANQLGYETLKLYGDVANLERYNEIDLHIGYRLHGHITFLRKRKPSILMVEDARAFGLSRTKGTAHGCIDAYNPEIADIDENAPKKAMEFIDEQVLSNFSDYNHIFDFIDATYKSFISPYFDKIAKTTLKEII